MVAPKNSSRLLVTLVALLLGSAAFASPVPCVNGLLALYAPLTNVSAPIACQYQDLIFTFSYQEFIYQHDPSQPPLGGADRIENHVDIAFINPAPGVEGISLSPTSDYLWLGQNGNSGDVNFTYDVSAANPSKPIVGATFDTTATITGLAGVFAGETVTYTTPGGPASLTLTINQFSTGTQSDTAGFTPAQTALNINKDLLMASVGAGDQVFLNSFDQTFNLNTPEPGVLILTGAGLMGFGLLSRRKKIGKALGVIVLLGLVSTAAKASPLCTSEGPTLNFFLNQTCTINGVSFTFGPTAYTYTFNGTPGIGNAIAASAVNVTVLSSPAGVGFQFVGQWAASGAQTGALTLQFSASAPGPINSGFFQTTTSKSGAGTVTGSSTITNGVPPGGYTFPSGGVPIPVVPPTTNVLLTAIVNVKGNGTSTGLSELRDNGHLSNLVITVHSTSGVPEPVTGLLLGSCLFGLAAVGRKRLQHQGV